MKWKPSGLEAADDSLSRDEYREIHHLGYVPALKVDGVVITEMPAILTYLASLAPERNLLGKSDVERAKIVEWMAFLSGYLHGQGYGQVFSPGRYSDNESDFPAIKERGRKIVDTSYRRINGLLQGKAFAVGDQDTVADFNLVIFWYWGVGNGFRMLDDYPNYAELVRRMESKASIRTTAQLEGKKLAFEPLL
jgi:glutathione S-transferase